MNVIIIDESYRDGTTREGEFVTHDGHPVPAGRAYVRHAEDANDVWYEVEMPADESGISEWTECMKAEAVR